MQRSFIREILEAISPQTLSLAGGLPDESLFPLQALSHCAQKVLSQPHSLQYSISQGLPALREKIAQHYRELGFPTSADEILITTGAQQALDLLSKALASSGLIVESPAYLGAIGAFKSNQIPLVEIKMEEDGIELESLRAELPKHRLAYLMSDFQNPTSQRYSLSKRQEIARLIESSEAILIEDGAYNELYFKERFPSISSLIPHRSFHVGTFSKILSPSLRVGFIRASKENLAKILPYKESMDLHTSGITQGIVNAFWEEYDFKAHKEKIRHAYALKAKALAQALQTHCPSFSFKEPEGGMFIYGSFAKGVDARALAFESLKQGAVFVPGGEFYLQRRQSPEARLNFTHLDPCSLDLGVQIIAQTLRAQTKQ